MDRPKPVVGQKLFSLNVGNAARRGRKQVLTPVIVKKVGRKYFVCGEEEFNYADTQYHLDTWQENYECGGPSSQLYESEQARNDEQECYKISYMLYKKFEYGKNGDDISLEIMKKIEELLK